MAFFDNAKTLAEYVHLCLDRHLRHTFLAEIDGRALTYAQTREQIVEIWALFRRAGIQRGDKVALLGLNSINWALVYLGAVTYGAVVVPILPDFQPAAIHNIVDLSEAKALFVSSNMIEKVEGIKAPKLERSFLLEDFHPLDLRAVPEFMKKIRVQVDLLRERASGFFGGRGASLRRRPEPPKPDDVAALVYTSGTTGHSKGVMLTQGNIVADLISAVRYVEVSPNDRFLSLLPLAHTYECTCGFLGPMSAGCSVYHLKGKPSPSVLLPAFRKVKPTMVFAVPLVIEKIYRKQVLARIESSAVLKAATKLPPVRRMVYRRAVRKLLEAFGGSLRQMGFGGAAIPPEVERFMIEGRFPYFVGYGMTECSPLITGCEVWRTRPGSCGRPMDCVEVRIANPGARTGVGEVQVKGPIVTPGYYKNAEATAALFTPDGWLATGDLGKLDADNYLYLIGRSKNVILGPSGENIYPEEIEHLFNQHPTVVESVVVERGGRLTALIHPDYEILTSELQLQAVPETGRRARIEKYFEGLLREVNAQVPGYSRVVGVTLVEEEFEKTPTNKIKRYLYA